VRFARERRVRDREDTIASTRRLGQGYGEPRRRATSSTNFASETHALLHFDLDRQQMIDVSVSGIIIVPREVIWAMDYGEIRSRAEAVVNAGTRT